MLEKFKNISIVSKILFLVAVGIFVFWVIPLMTTYYKNLNKYEEKVNSIGAMMERYNLHSESKVFDMNGFKNELKALFVDVSIQKIGNEQYKVNITLNQNDIDTFNNYLEKISLEYLVELDGALEFEEKEEKLLATFILQPL